MKRAMYWLDMPEIVLVTIYIMILKNHKFSFLMDVLQSSPLNMLFMDAMFSRKRMPHKTAVIIEISPR